MREIYAEYVHSREALGRAPNEHSALPLEVFIPVVFARIENRNDLSRVVISARDIRSLMRIAPKTTERKILFHCFAVMLASNDVVDLKRDGIELLRRLAVFAT